MGSTGNAYTPRVIDQLSYITQWFKEWSEMQKADFLPILVQTFENKECDGLVSNMDNINLEDRRLSIFQCRIKLFKEWSEGWSQDEKDQLIAQLKTVDEDFINKYETEIGSNSEPAKSESTEMLNGNVENSEVFN